MIRKIQLAIVCVAGILIASVTCVGQATSPSYSHAELKKMISEAHTAEQYRTLAEYFSLRENSYHQKAAEEKQEWDRLSRNVPVFSAAKYPRPVDASRNYYYSLRYKARKMSLQASHYEGLSASAAQ
jgi:hypothetical protein